MLLLLPLPPGAELLRQRGRLGEAEDASKNVKGWFGCGWGRRHDSLRSSCSRKGIYEVRGRPISWSPPPSRNVNRSWSRDEKKKRWRKKDRRTDG